MNELPPNAVLLIDIAKEFGKEPVAVRRLAQKLKLTVGFARVKGMNMRGKLQAKGVSWVSQRDAETIRKTLRKDVIDLTEAAVRNLLPRVKEKLRNKEIPYASAFCIRRYLNCSTHIATQLEKELKDEHS